MYTNHSLYCSPNIVRVIKSRRLRWAGHVARMEEGRSAFKILTGKPTGKRPLGRLKHRWKDNIRMDIEKMGINAGNLVDLAQDRDYWRALVNAALNLWVPYVMDLVVYDLLFIFHQFNFYFFPNFFIQILNTL